MARVHEDKRYMKIQGRLDIRGQQTVDVDIFENQAARVKHDTDPTFVKTIPLRLRVTPYLPTELAKKPDDTKSLDDWHTTANYAALRQVPGFTDEDGWQDG